MTIILELLPPFSILRGKQRPQWEYAQLQENLEEIIFSAAMKVRCLWGLAAYKLYKLGYTPIINHKKTGKRQKPSKKLPIYPRRSAENPPNCWFHKKPKKLRRLQGSRMPVACRRKVAALQLPLSCGRAQPMVWCCWICLAQVCGLIWWNNVKNNQ